jgi:hypothetical protein
LVDLWIQQWARGLLQMRRILGLADLPLFSKDILILGVRRSLRSWVARCITALCNHNCVFATPLTNSGPLPLTQFQEKLFFPSFHQNLEFYELQCRPPGYLSKNCSSNMHDVMTLMWDINTYTNADWGTLLVPQLVEALRYESEGRGFESQWCHWHFSLT